MACAGTMDTKTGDATMACAGTMDTKTRES